MKTKKAARTKKAASVLWHNGYNIPMSTMWYARRYPWLRPLATGGGCDYIIAGYRVGDSRSDNRGVEMVLSAVNSAESPSLTDPAIVSVYFILDYKRDGDGIGVWWNSIMFRFPTAMVALDFMATCDPSMFEGQDGRWWARE